MQCKSCSQQQGKPDAREHVCQDCVGCPLEPFLRFPRARVILMLCGRMLMCLRCLFFSSFLVHLGLQDEVDGRKLVDHRDERPGEEARTEGRPKQAAEDAHWTTLVAGKGSGVPGIM